MATTTTARRSPAGEPGDTAQPALLGAVAMVGSRLDKSAAPLGSTAHVVSGTAGVHTTKSGIN
ncbi:MAG: hypothetical protein ABIP39_11990, partial [Polyangiaceae bacterium]